MKHEVGLDILWTKANIQDVLTAWCKLISVLYKKGISYASMNCLRWAIFVSTKNTPKKPFVWMYSTKQLKKSINKARWKWCINDSIDDVSESGDGVEQQWLIAVYRLTMSKNIFKTCSFLWWHHYNLQLTCWKYNALNFITQVKIKYRP